LVANYFTNSNSFFLILILNKWRFRTLLASNSAIFIHFQFENQTSVVQVGGALQCSLVVLFFKVFCARIKMKKINVKSKIRREELNPVFHFKDKEEDDKVLTKNLVREALKTGKLSLAGKNLKFGKCGVENRWKFVPLTASIVSSHVLLGQLLRLLLMTIESITIISLISRL
jgi:hypothetical protein